MHYEPTYNAFYVVRVMVWVMVRLQFNLVLLITMIIQHYKRIITLGKYVYKALLMDALSKALLECLTDVQGGTGTTLDVSWLTYSALIHTCI